MEEAIRVASEYDANYIRTLGNPYSHEEGKSPSRLLENAMMDINYVRPQSSGGRNNQNWIEKARLKREGRCFLCKEKGHMANKCTTRKRIVEINHFIKMDDEMKRNISEYGMDEKENSENTDRNKKEVKNIMNIIRKHSSNELVKINGMIGLGVFV